MASERLFMWLDSPPRQKVKLLPTNSMRLGFLTVGELEWSGATVLQPATIEAITATSSQPRENY